MPYMLVDALVNKKQHSSNSPVSKYIRQCCYSILGVPEVKEYCIEGDRAVISMVRSADSLQPCYSISEVSNVNAPVYYLRLFIGCVCRGVPESRI